MNSVFADDGIHTFVLTQRGEELFIEVRNLRDGWGKDVKVPKAIAEQIARRAAKGK